MAFFVFTGTVSSLIWTISSLVMDANRDAIFSELLGGKQQRIFRVDQPIRTRLQRYLLFQYILTRSLVMTSSVYKVFKRLPRHFLSYLSIDQKFVFFFCRMHHRLPLFLALCLSVRRFQMTLEGLSFEKTLATIIYATNHLLQNMTKIVCLRCLTFDIFNYKPLQTILNYVHQSSFPHALSLKQSQ